jgi:hypothetical protein
MTNAQSPEYGRLNPMSHLMISSLETLVRCESPTEDLAACREVVQVASAIAADVLGTPAQIREIEGRPVFWWGDAKPKIVSYISKKSFWPSPKVDSALIKLSEIKKPSSDKDLFFKISPNVYASSEVFIPTIQDNLFFQTMLCLIISA